MAVISKRFENIVWSVYRRHGLTVHPEKTKRIDKDVVVYLDLSKGELFSITL